MFPAAVHRCDTAGREIGGDASCLAEEAIRQEHMELCTGTASNCSVCGYVGYLSLSKSGIYLFTYAFAGPLFWAKE